MRLPSRRVSFFFPADFFATILRGPSARAKTKSRATHNSGEREDNEAATRGAEKLGVRSFPGMARVAQGSPAESACMGAGAAKSVERGHQRGVDCKLDPSSQRQHSNVPTFGAIRAALAAHTC